MARITELGTTIVPNPSTPYQAGLAMLFYHHSEVKLLCSSQYTQQFFLTVCSKFHARVWPYLHR